MRRPTRLILAAASTALAATALLAQGTGGARHVRITYQDLTAGQSFSPTVFASHNGAAPKLFTMGGKASPGLSQLAEGGNVGPIAGMAGMMMGKAIGSSVIGLPTMPGHSGSVELMVDAAHPMISGGWMLGMTNDGFTGFNGLNVYNLRKAASVDLMAYDAGSEKNNEKRAYLPALMGLARDPEGGMVTMHKGLRGNADAPAKWAFDPRKPVARVTVTPLG